MTKEELAKKKGLKLQKEEKSPAESLLTTIFEPIKTEKVVEPPLKVEIPIIEPKRPVGKPKKRKAGDKKTSVWIDSDNVEKMQSRLKYGDSASDLINIALREYLERN